MKKRIVSKTYSVALLTLAYMSWSISAAEAPSVQVRTPEPEDAEAKPPRFLASNEELEPMVSLARAQSAVPAEIAAIAAWNATGKPPAKNGFLRIVPVPLSVRLDSRQLQEGFGGLAGGVFKSTQDSLIWGSRLEIEGAWRLRARLADLHVPPGTDLWVYGERGDATHFGSELIRPDGDLWTPSVEGPVLGLEVRVPATALTDGGVVSFSLDRLAELFLLDDRGTPVLDLKTQPKSCTESAACWSHPDPQFEFLRNATSYIETITADGAVSCSGTLMNDTDAGDLIPYFLTAKHCIGDQNAPLFILPRVHGARVLSTRPASDSAFLRLFSSPGGLRGYAGWTSEAPRIGEELYSFSHPNGRSMRFSATELVDRPFCAGLSQAEYLFSDQVVGGVQGGSSGSHVFNADLRVVGQLRGACGSDASDGCFYSLNDRVDGRFSRFFPQIAGWLSPGTSQASCMQDHRTACLNGDRFEVRAGYFASGSSGQGHAVELTDDTGYFWFFERSNVEVLLKVIDGCGSNGNYWIFAGGLTDLGIKLNVRDTVTGDTWSGGNQLGRPFATVTDTEAFRCR